MNWASIKSWEMSISGFPQALDINPCPRTIVYNNREVINVSGDVLNADEFLKRQIRIWAHRVVFQKKPYYYRCKYENEIDEDAENTKIKDI